MSDASPTTGSFAGLGPAAAGYYVYYALYAAMTLGIIAVFVVLPSKRYEMRGRMPAMVICGAVGALLVLLNFAIFNNVPASVAEEFGLCIAGELLQAAGFYMFAVSYLVRAIYIHFLFKSRKADVRSISKQAKQRELFLGFFGGLFGVLFLFGMLQLIRAKVIHQTCSIVVTQAAQTVAGSLAAGVIELCVMFILLLVAGIIVLRVPDQFNIGLEIRIASIGYLMFGIVAIIMLIKQASFIAIPLMVYFPCCFAVTAFGPYFMWRKQQKAMKKCNTLEMQPVASADNFRLKLADADFLAEFRQFAAEEFSIENVFLWEELVRYRNAALKEQSTDATDIAKMICEQFIGPNARLQVNLDEKVTEPVIARILSGDDHHPDLFIEIERLILNLMYFDTYHRYYADRSERSSMHSSQSQSTFASIA